MKHGQKLGASAVIETIGGGLVETASALLIARNRGHRDPLGGGLVVMLKCLDAVRAAGVEPPTAPRLDARSAEFLSKGSASIELALAVADEDDLTWRTLAVAKFLQAHEQWLAKVRITLGDEEQKAAAPAPSQAAEPVAVRVVAMPQRESLQTVDRDDDGEIRATLTVARDVVSPSTAA